MAIYILKRLLLIIPTLLGILLLNFIIIQAAPGGPVEQMIAKMQGLQADSSLSTQLAGSQQDLLNDKSAYRGETGLPPEMVERIKKLYGFDKPPLTRFWLMLKHYAHFNFGFSYYKDKSVLELIKERLPVSISLGLWSTLITYLVAIPLGIRKAVKNGSRFDAVTTQMIVVGYAVPSFLFAILLIVLFAGGSYFNWFPLRGLVSDNVAQLSFLGRVADYAWHLVLPTLAIVIGSFATLTLLTKNCFLDEISKQYVQTARAKGLTEKQVLYHHVFRNAMLIIIAGFPAAFIGVFFNGVLLIEYIFSLNGLGLLSFESAINRDYPVVFGTLFIFTLFGMILKLISDLMYMWVDPRIDFERREG
jgi:microcin C transport system permease protein